MDAGMFGTDQTPQALRFGVGPERYPIPCPDKSPGDAVNFDLMQKLHMDHSNRGRRYFCLQQQELNYKSILFNSLE